MKIAIVYGYLEKRDGDGNGLRALADAYRKNGWEVDIFESFDSITDKYEKLIGHSYGGHQAIKYCEKATWPITLTLIDPVKQGWWYRPWVLLSKFKLPYCVKSCVCYYTNSFPPSCQVEPRFPMAINIKMPGTTHVSIVKAVVEKVLRP